MLRKIWIGAVVMAVGGLWMWSGSVSAADEDGKVVVVSMGDDDTFQPAKITVAPGTVVRWTNVGKTDAHVVSDDVKVAKDAKDVSIPAGAKAFRSGEIKPGGTFDQTFTVAGEYKYICVPHEGMGMKGEITVVAP